MISLISLLEDLFGDPKISDKKLQAGALDHLERLRARSADDLVPGIIDRTENFYKAFVDELSRTGTGLAGQKGATLTVEGMVDKLLAFVRESENYINYKFKDPADRLLFYPRGLTEYNKARIGDWTLLLDRYGKAVADHSTALGAPFVTEFTNLQQDWATATGKQSGLKSVVKEGRSGAGQQRPNLTKVLTRNLHALADHYWEDTTQVLAFFDQRFFETRTRSHRGERSGSVSPNRTDTLFDTLPASGSVTLHNKGEEPLEFYRSKDRSVSLAGVLTLAGGESKTLPLSDLPGEGPLLLVHNPGSHTGYYEAELGE